jgi:hypothetical protein
VNLWADIDLLLKHAPGGVHPAAFRIDSATDITTFPAYQAKRLNLAMPLTAAPGVRHNQTGLEIRPGVLAFRVAAMDQTVYAVACFFLGDPDTPPNPGQAATFPRNLLQPLALVDRLRFTMQKDPALGSPYGEVVVEKV